MTNRRNRLLGENQQFTSSGSAGNSTGSVLANILTGSWRALAETHHTSEEDLSLVAPQLYQSGAAALAWWRIQNSTLAKTAIGTLLHDAYRHLKLAARIHEREIKLVVKLFRSAGIEPVLVKGWAIARLYPDSALRPYGDIDLCVAPAQFLNAEAVLEGLANTEGHFVDLHDGFTKLTASQRWRGPTARVSDRMHDGTRIWDELYERSQLVDFDGQNIRVLSDEDHLRVLCVHLLRSGGWRPLWLCDVAILLESRKPDFDWDICLTIDRRQADWIACTIGLAHHLLGVEVEDTPVTERAKHLPRWLVPAVLRQWDRCRNSHAAGTALPTLLSVLTEPKSLLAELYARWDNPVRSTTSLRGRFNDWPRWPYQLCELIKHSPELPRQLSLMIREGLWKRTRPSDLVPLEFAPSKSYSIADF